MDVREIDRSLEQWQMGVKDLRRRRMIRAPTPRERERWYAILLLAQGLTAAATAQALGRDPHTSSGVDQKHTGYLTVPKSFICFERASARLTVRTDGLPRWETSFRRERSDSVSLTLYLMAAMSGYSPTERSYPSMTAFSYSYISIWKWY